MGLKAVYEKFHSIFSTTPRKNFAHLQKTYAFLWDKLVRCVIISVSSLC